MLRTAPDGFCLLNLQGQFLDVNDAYCRLTGYRRDELLKMSAADMDASMTAENIDTRIQTLIHNGPDLFETRHRTKDSRMVDVEVSLNLVYPSKRLFCFVRDITERRRAEQQLTNYAMALEASNAVLERFNGAAEAATKAKSGFLANVSHQIRTAMTVIHGYTDLLLEQCGSDGCTFREPLEIIRRSSDHLLKIINNIQDISEIEAGKLKIDLDAYSPAALIDEVRAMMQTSADAKGLTLRAECVGPVPEAIHTDPVRLRQILMTLVGNAVKYTEQGGVRLLARFLDGNHPKMHFDVIDTGVGMTYEQRVRPL